MCLSLRLLAWMERTSGSFQCFVTMESGSQCTDKQRCDSAVAHLLAACLQYNVLGTRGPRKMTAAIPAVDESNRRIEATNMLDRCACVCVTTGGLRGGMCSSAQTGAP
jgi:hypothetical protein